MSETQWPPVETEEEYRKRMMALPGYIILAVRPDEDFYVGLTENSFSLGVEEDRVQFFCGDRAWELASHRLKQYRGWHPDWSLYVFDAKDEKNLPVELDWEQWLKDRKPTDLTFSGVTNKYGARNMRFRENLEKPFIHGDR